MGSFFYSSVLLMQLLVLQPWLSIASTQPKNSQTYIIHMDHSQKPPHFSDHESWHHQTLKSLSSVCDEDEDNHRGTFLYSYTHVMQGFSAKLTPCQLSQLEKSRAHLATYKESFGKLFTTHTPKFLGLKRNSGIWPTASYGEDVIIGMIDTGIWPESESFSDKGMAKVPSRWKGKCENGTAFSPSICNNKLIGATSFSKGLEAAGLNISTEFDFDSPRDFLGHGSHTSSTAAGNHVVGANHFGYAQGVARGMAPRAHIAMYKVLWASDSFSSASTDILAGMDQAISDGVDIMSISLGLDHTPFFEDVIAIASLSAIEKGIVVVCAAGNDGPGSSSIYNGAPWIMTVGAGTIDRSYMATLELGNGLTFVGTSYFPMSVSITNTHLYYGNNDPRKAGCSALNPLEVAGKIMDVVTRAGAYAAIFLTESLFLDPEDYTSPGILLHTSYAAAIKEYAMKGNTSIVKKMKFVLTETGTGPAPEVAYFSSRGPDPITPSVLKPDILAPGVDVLGAVRPDLPFMVVGKYDLVTDYALYSGTSMAAPHVAGVAALLKSIHGDWTPAAIRSALMTTATNTDNRNGIIEDQWYNQPATPLDFGAGHIYPNKAMDPGLIYDMGFQDYIDFLCGLGYTDQQMSAVIRRSRWSCSTNHTELNYPSFIADFSNQTTSPLEKHFIRTVTNVGDPRSTYQAVVEVPARMTVRVEPKTIRFTSKYQSEDFVMSIQMDKRSPNVTYGYLKWIDEHNHTVSSPIVVIGS
ncbi:subtilisin-like protease SBT1.9 [Cynara cardunculus var. scolymus]|uniref:subtilisin-like protease SBT1.9 n=1 Tax=Cynara cardunculus var. scolymus TaxID=59895 RepID=UPI000D626514|nr:subtilisin-like protease SBT1.9 [Cynara cardunculus var. scolymus]